MPDGVFDADFGAIEVGCSVYSKTRTTASDFPVGGVVIDLADDRVYVLRDLKPSDDEPTVVQIVEDDVDNGEVALRDRFYTRNAGVAAMQLFGWLAKQNKSQRTRSGLTEWAALAVRLQGIRDAATLTPRAEQRYRAAQEARWREAAS